MATPLDPALVDQIRASLYEGRGVRLFGDDAPTTMLDPSTEMTPEGDAFLTGKLEKVAELLEQGFVVNIDSQGSILAVTPDRQSRYISTQEAEIDVMDRLMVKQAIEAGAKVSFEQDGSLVIDGHSAPTPPSAAHAAAQFAEFERLADSGDINAELAAGRDFAFDAAAVADPTPPVVVDDPFDTAAELQAEADSLQLGIDAMRDLGRPEYVAAKEAAEVERLAADRSVAMAKAERDEAATQAAAAQAEATNSVEYAAYQRTLAAEMRAAGDESGADAAENDALTFDSMVEVNNRVAKTAQQALDDAEQRLLEATETADQAVVASHAVNERFGAEEQVYNEQEEQISRPRLAAAELAEAERLEAALPDLEARGVEGLERVHDAIAAHRAAAEAHVEAGNLRATTGIVIEGSDAMDPDATDPDATDPDAYDPEAYDPDGFVPDPGGPAPVDPALEPDGLDPYPFEPEGFDPPVDPAPGDPEGSDPYDVMPTEADEDSLRFNSLEGGGDAPPAVMPVPVSPPSDMPVPTEPDDSTVNDNKNDVVDPGQFEPSPIGPEDFEPEWPSEVDAPADFSTDFAAEVTEIEQIEDDLDGLADF